MNSEYGNQLFRQFKLFLEKSPILVAGPKGLNYPEFERFESEHPILYAAAGFAPGVRMSLCRALRAVLSQCQI